tara:strand:- start:15 stop:353 length:339 start_codon:yes stop_codon:yes gene_type:complete
MKTEEIRIKLNEENPRSNWGKAVITYANELLDHLEDQIKFHGPSLEINEKTLLNGAENWKHYSEAGNSLIYYGDISERVCTPSELKRCKEENLMEIQGRALFQASRLILNQI